MPEKLTLEQAQERFGNATIAFTFYYKYVFTFEGVHEGYKITCAAGGDYDSCYNLHVTPEPIKLGNIEDDWRSVTIMNAAGEEVFCYEDFS